MTKSYSREDLQIPEGLSALPPEEAQKPQPEEGEDPRDEPEYEFSISWPDPRGTLHEGAFKNRAVKNLGVQARIDQLKAGYLDGKPAYSFDQAALNRFHIVAHMTCTLVERPKWAHDLFQVEWEALLWEIWNEVDAHERTYFRRPAHPAEGQEG